MFDTIRWDAALPAGHPPEDLIFQTKSLDNSLAHYCVTPEGRLLLIGSGWQGEDIEHAPDLQAIDVDFHGDIKIWSEKGDLQYLVRFTHGSLEWIKPVADDEPWDSVAIASMKFYASAAKEAECEKNPASLA